MRNAECGVRNKKINHCKILLPKLSDFFRENFINQGVVLKHDTTQQMSLSDLIGQSRKAHRNWIPRLNRGMTKRKNRSIWVLYLVLTMLFYSGSVVYADNNEFQFKKQAEIQQVRPPKPVKIKVHRNAKGEYSWELSGDNVDELAVVDRKLRKALKPD